jgi:cytochrome c556
MRRATRLSATAVAILTLIPSVVAHEHATGVVKERMDGMAAMAKSMKSIGQRIKAGRDLGAIRTDAEAILPMTSKIAAWFPAGSNQHPSEARAEIWEKWSDFESKGHALELEVSKLVAIDTTDRTVLTAQVRAVNQACSACHELYRQKKR